MDSVFWHADEAFMNDFFVRSFRDVADGDYVVARMAYRARLVPQFLTAAHQALEKLGKCVLTLNRIETNDLRHDLQRTVDRFGRLKFEVRLSPSTRQFIEYLDGQGAYRYGEACYWTHGPEIIRLDRAVWELRRYARVIDYDVRAGSRKVHMLQPEIKGIEAAERAPHKYRIIGGELEKIIADRSNPAHKPLLWQNAWFGNRLRKTVSIAAYLYGSNSPLSLHPHILSKVRKYVRLPKEAITAYQALAVSQAQASQERQARVE